MSVDSIRPLSAVQSARSINSIKTVIASFVTKMRSSPELMTIIKPYESILKRVCITKLAHIVECITKLAHIDDYILIKNTNQY